MYHDLGRNQAPRCAGSDSRLNSGFVVPYPAAHPLSREFEEREGPEFQFHHSGLFRAHRDF
jgi:hypothetical protein